LDDASDLIIFLLILTLRLLVPLAIPRFPLPAIVTALILDGIDQTVFQKFTTLDLAGYQGYDKALDVYYLTIAYLSTMRNWSNLYAFEVARFLLYYRLVGVLIFEYTQNRTVLLIFPNTFEYFFIFYEAVRLRWNPRRMSRHLVLGAAAAIWIFIKLPQEYWIHVAQKDVTDTLRENPILIPIIAVAAVVLLAVGWWVVTRRCPPADWSPSLADPLDMDQGTEDLKNARRLFTTIGFDRSVLEKIALVSLVSVIFAQILPDLESSDLELAIGIAIIIVGNTFVSELLARRGVDWTSAVREFVAMSGINIGLALGFYWLLPFGDGDIRIGSTLFFLLLLTLLVVLYDRFRPYYLERLSAQGAG
jgi:hypothetical protein